MTDKRTEVAGTPAATNAEKNINMNSGAANRTAETHPTSYTETIMHLFKGNIGPGLFAMGDAFKNGGLIAAPILTLIIAVICVHCQHILVNCSKSIRAEANFSELPDYAETVEHCFATGPSKLRKFSSKMKTIVNIFICVTQFGFCCIYFVFISSNFKQILDHYGHNFDIHILMIFIYVPILIPSLLTKLKFLAPVSGVANFCMITGIIITMYFAFQNGFPDTANRHYITDGSKLALYFGTAIFAFEGIALVLPLKSSMKKQENFEKGCGVLNIGMTAVTFLFIFAGFFGYLKWGEDVGGSLTLNLDVHNWLAQYVKIAVSIGVLLGYPLQFFIAIQIMWPNIQQLFGVKDHPLFGELIFRFVMVTVTFGVAELVPQLNLFISLIGALCSSALALVFPPLIELISKSENSKGPGFLIFFKNIAILIMALIGFATGSYESLSAIIYQLRK